MPLKIIFKNQNDTYLVSLSFNKILLHFLISDEMLLHRYGLYEQRLKTFSEGNFLKVKTLIKVGNILNSPLEI